MCPVKVSDTHDLHYEKNRNENLRNMENPFKFGTIVEEVPDAIQTPVMRWPIVSLTILDVIHIIRNSWRLICGRLVFYNLRYPTP